MKSLAIWSLLFGISLLVHAVISWRVGQDIDQPVDYGEEVKIRITVTQPPIDRAEQPPPEDVLEFEEEFEIEPPETLIAPQAVTPPPPDAPLALRAASGGKTGFDLPNPRVAGPLGEGLGSAGFGRGIGNALGNSSNRFAAYVSDLRNSGLDIVFAIDATSSMGWALDEIKGRINDIVRAVRTLVPTARFGFVAYRDRDDEEFAVRLQPLTFSTANLRDFLDPLEADGGGDIAEDIGAGLAVGIDQSGWRVGARRIIVIVGDGPPREEDFDDLLRTIARFTATGGTISTLDVSPSANPELVEIREGAPVDRKYYRGKPMREFLIISDAGNGDAGTLAGDVNITKRLLTLIMGEQFAKEMRALFEVI